MQPAYMGQDLLNPPSVEGWHTGPEWINSGSLMARINFVAGLIGDPSLPGVRAIIDRLKAKGTLTPEQLVDGCLDLLGPSGGGLRNAARAGRAGQGVGPDGLGIARRSSKTADKRVGEMLQLIVATREYQFA